MKISCIMSNYNTPSKYLRLALESVLCQTFKNIEVIIVDDASTNGTLDVLKEFKEKDSRIKVLCNEQNLGLVRSLNLALDNATGDYIARMDTDDISDIDRFEKQINYLLENNLDLVGSETRRIDECNNVIINRTNYSYTSNYINHAIKHDNVIAHPTWLARKEVYKALNGYRLINACEDYDFLLRAVKKGFKLGICNSVLLSYRINTNGISQSNLLIQKESSRYLARNLDRIESVTQGEITTNVIDRINDNDKSDFMVAMAYYDLFRKKIKERDIASFKYLIKSLVKSKYIINNYIDLLNIVKCRVLYK